MGRRAKSPKGKADATRALTRKSPKNESSEIRALEKRLAESLEREKETLEQQTATSEILRIISQSPTDAQPVFDAITRSAVRLCDGVFSAVIRFDGELQHLVAQHNFTPAALEAWRQVFPMPPSRINVSGRAILDRAVAHIEDIETDSGVGAAVREAARTLGYRSILSVPMFRDGRPVGTINVARREVAPFSDNEIELLKTFANQAVIAIENVRLFNELEARNRDLTDSLEQQTATSDILGVISSSPTDVQPVFDAIAASAVRLCEGLFGAVFRFDGERVYFDAHSGFTAEGLAAFRSFYPQPIDQLGSVMADAIRKGTPQHSSDVLTDPRVTGAVLTAARALGHRSIVVMPLLREGKVIGTLNVARAKAEPFSDTQIALLQTFADQAVIAIENVRLFKELEARNRAVTESLEKQTATAEILGVISRSQNDVQPVFDAIVRNAVRLCDAMYGDVYRFDGAMVHLVAHHNFHPEQLVRWQQRFPRAPGGGIGRVIETHGVVCVSDVESDDGSVFGLAARELMRAHGTHSALLVPMSRNNAVIGVITLTHRHVGAFTEAHAELLQTFADQAVIAIENVRLFTELQASNRELTTALDTQTATSDILRVISRSQTDVQPVFDAIVESAVRLLGAYTGALTRIAGDELELVALTSTDDAGDAALRALFPRSLQSLGATYGPSIRNRVPLNVADAQTDPRLSEASHAYARVRGYRSQVVVPMLRHDEAIGTIAVTRREPGGFTGDEITLLQTFADQAVIAIENARLFREIENKSRQLEAASQHKSEFLANMSHELRTPLNAIIGFSEVLTERMFGELNEKQDEYLKDIYASGQHLLSLINDILDLSKIEAGRMELEPADFDLPGAIDNALTLVRERAGRRGITLGRAIDERVGVIRADERKVKQVLLNLLSNALKFTPEGGRIDVRAAVSNGMVEVSVADTGVGIAPEDQEAVFEEFRQVGTADKKVEGTGLGLALSRKFIELHGGRIWVKSRVGTGSTFTFTIPVRREPSDQGVAAATRSA